MGSSGVWWWWLLLGGLAGWLASWLAGPGLARSSAVALAAAPDGPLEPSVEKIVEVVVERPVDRIVEKMVDNPAHLDRIRELEDQVASIPGLRGTIAQLQSGLANVGAKVVDGAGPAVPAVHPVAANAPQPERRSAPQPVVSPVGLGNGLTPQRAPGKIMDRAMDLVIDRTAAGAAGYAVRGMDDFEVIVGINTGIAALLKAQGIRMFWELAQTPQPRLQAILDSAGGDFGTANPSTWARQAGLAANNQWGELRMLQDVLEADV